jgi:hypothetical protein
VATGAQRAADEAAANGATYPDPFAYCEAVDTADAPDSRYTGPAVPDAVAQKVGATTPTEIASTHWRCMSANVMACRVTGKAPVCDQLPSADQMIAYCKDHPDTGPIPVPSGDWVCEGGHPVIPKGQRWPVDRRGFYPPAWKPVPNPAATQG